MQLPTDPDKKKLIIILAGFGVVLLLIMVVLISINSSSKDSTVTSSPPKQSDNTSIKTNPEKVSASAEPTISDGWKEYKNTLFGINYPPNWKAEETRLASGGIALKIKPATDVGSQFTPNVVVIVDTISSVPSIKQKEQIFVNLGLKSDTVLLNNLPATRLSGIMPRGSKTSTQSAVFPDLQITHVFLERGNYSYLFDSSYVSKGTNAQIETILSKMVTSFKFSSGAL